MKYTIDDAIHFTNYILNSLILTKDIVKTPSCNNCNKKDCEHKPKPGETTRFNCFLWEGVSSENEK